MNYLNEYGFTHEELEEFSANVPSKLLEQLFNSYLLVSKNLDYLKEIGVEDYKNLFIKYYDMFLMDYSNFVSIFSKYEQSDLIKKINENIDIVEFL